MYMQYMYATCEWADRSTRSGNLSIHESFMPRCSVAATKSHIGQDSTYSTAHYTCMFFRGRCISASFHTRYIDDEYATLYIGSIHALPYPEHSLNFLQKPDPPKKMIHTLADRQRPILSPNKLARSIYLNLRAPRFDCGCELCEDVH